MHSRLASALLALTFLLAGMSCRGTEERHHPAVLSPAVATEVPSEEARLRHAYVAAAQRDAGERFRFVHERGAARANAPMSIAVSSTEVRAAGITMQAVSVGGDVAAPGKGKLEVSGNVVSIDHGAMTETYVNGPLGLEQSFTVVARSERDTAKLHARIRFDGAMPELEGSKVVLRHDGRVVAHYTDLFALDAEGRFLPTAMAVDDDIVTLVVDDANAAYPIVIDPLLWTEDDKLLAADGVADDSLGTSVAIDGDWAVVGAHRVDDGLTNSGAAYFFQRVGGAWVEQDKVKHADPVAYDIFGVAVAIDGDRAAIGASFHNAGVADSGAVYVFERTGTAWSQVAKLVHANPSTLDRLGHSVAIEDDTVLAGAYGDDGEAGSAFVFVDSGGNNWSEQAKLTADDAAAGSRFGISVDLEGGTALIGAYHDSAIDTELGAAYVFAGAGASWTQQAKLVPAAAVGGDQVGVRLALSGDTAVLGAPNHDVGGAVFTFDRSGGTWTEGDVLVGSDTASGDDFGLSLALLGDTAMVGASAHAGQGAAYYFARDDGSWMQRDKIMAGDGAAGDLFGNAVALATGQALVSARDDDAMRGAVYAYSLLDDGTPCTGDFECESGFCVDGVCCENSCSGGATDDCLTCATGACIPEPDGIDCDDGNLCTQLDRCVAGTCDGQDPVVCATPDQCHDAGLCDPGTGVCLNVPKADDTPCDDGSACTQTDSCQAGICIGGDPVVCAAQDACHDAGVCDALTGMCTHPAKADGSVCSDGDLCTQTDTCQSGVCTAGSPVVCSALDACHDVGTCNPATGVCSNPAKVDGATCDDGDRCTQTDSCIAGSCVGGSPVQCVASDSCHDVGVCDPATGTCSDPQKPDGSLCSDGDPCTQLDVCDAGACTAGPAVACAPPDACHEAGVCNADSGACEHTPVADGTVCAHESGAEGTCQGGACIVMEPQPPDSPTNVGGDGGCRASGRTGGSGRFVWWAMLGLLWRRRRCWR